MPGLARTLEADPRPYAVRVRRDRTSIARFVDGESPGPGLDPAEATRRLSETPKVEYYHVRV